MVLNKRLDFGFNGFQVPTIPKAPRSARRRRAQRNAVEDGPICAFELLASLAAKLLRESESSSASSHASQGNTQSAFSKDVKQELQDGHKPLKDECLYQNCYEESVPIELTSKAIDRNCTKKKLLHAECASVIHNASFSRHRNDSKLGVRDDDEKFSWCDKLSTMVKVFRPRSLIGDRRIRKLLASKYWKVAPKVRECDNLIYDGRVKPTYHKRKIFYNHERTRRDTLCKRRKMVTQSSIVTSDGGLKGMNGDKNVPVNGVSSSIKGPQASLFSRESHVKFRIKSVSVPELFIEVPTTETIGSLKKTVMEAVNAILNGGLNVGVLVQGKKVRDDNRTLLQSGISCKDNQDSLGFMLESSPVEAPAYLCRADPLPLSCDASVLLRGSPSTPLQNRGLPDIVSDHTLLLTNPDLVESDHEKSCFSHIEPLTNEGMPECQATVALPYMSMEPLAAVPVNLKCKRPEVMQRRTRRPFSVTEVEALVQAVEDLGTGRWRDIKLSAFDNADHRTYVDLKDKWKTLVHTAQISPQQRRGEPVPQELLDRVLAAHLYLSQNQAKQQGKHETCIRRITDTNSTDGAERYSPLSYDVENSKVDRNREKEMPVKITLP